MMTELQEKEITDYLISKNIPLDILMEIKDHVMDQTLEIQNAENISFEGAFSKVKEYWSEELKMTDNIWLYPEPIPVIAKKIIKTKYKGLLEKSVLIALLSFAVNLMVIYSLNSEETYKIGFRVLNSIFFIIPLVVVVFHYKTRNSISNDFRYKGKIFYTLYQQNTRLLMISTLSMVQILGKNGKYAYEFFRTPTPTNIMYVLITLILPFFLQTAVIFSLLNFFEHKKTLKKMHHFLDPSS